MPLSVTHRFWTQNLAHKKISWWQTDEKFSWHKVKWTETEGYINSVEKVAKRFLRSLDFIAHLGYASTRIKSTKRKNTHIKIDQVWTEVYVGPLANKSLENIDKFIYRAIKMSLCFWWIQYRSQVQRDFLITLYLSVAVSEQNSMY